MDTQPHRRSIRLKGYDYTQPGAYFVTLLAWQRQCLFGEMGGDEVHLNEIGRIIEEEWLRSSTIRSEIELDEFVVMPNHFHAIVWIVEADLVRATGRSPLPDQRDPSPLPPHGPKPASVGALIAGFKSACSTRINSFRNTPGQPVWHRNYYERIIRNERELDATRLYIRDNPRQWAEDSEYPSVPR